MTPFTSSSMDRFVPRDDKVALSFARDDDAFVIASEARQSLREISCTDRFVPRDDEVVGSFVTRDDEVVRSFVKRDDNQNKWGPNKWGLTPI